MLDSITISEGWGMVFAAIITAIASLFVGFIVTRNKRKELNQAKAELDFQRYSLDFGQFLEEWEGTHKEILNLLETTNIDRFLILRAWNGVNHPKWTTSVLQIRQGIQEPIAYVHFELDADYIDRMQELKKEGNAYYKVEDMPNSSIKNVYKTEGVTSALWSLIGISEPIDGNQAITYCSFATHSDEELTDEEQLKATAIVGRLQGISDLFNDRNA